MNKLQTLTLLQSYLDDEFAWRLKEIADVKLVVKQSKDPYRRTLIRAGVPLLYAHWEGFIKNSALAYVNFVNCQGLTYRELDSCFVVFGAKKLLVNMAGSKKARLNIEAVDFFFDKLDQQAQLGLAHAVDTESNLKSPVFENIVLSLGIDTSQYEPRYNLIDESLLRRRNEIAHGEFVDLGPDDFRELADDVLLLMRWFKTDVENGAATKAYARLAV